MCVSHILASSATLLMGKIFIVAEDAFHGSSAGKRRKVERSVGEYWIVDPDNGTVSVYCFRESAEPVPYSFTDRIPSATYENLSIDFAALSEYLR